MQKENMILLEIRIKKAGRLDMMTYKKLCAVKI